MWTEFFPDGLMPAFSSRLQVLLERLSVLETHFLPAVLPPPHVPPSDEEEDRVKAYLLLAHAEIEDYVETRAKGIILKALDDWKTSTRTSPPLLGLAALSPALKPLEKRAPLSPGPDSLTAHLNGAFAIYLDSIDRNHGVTEKNLLRMILPLGISEYSLDIVWLGDMTSFAALRGEIAHKSRSTTKQEVHPATEHARIQGLLGELLKLDLMMTSIAE
jgi:hypothetical protein